MQNLTHSETVAEIAPALVAAQAQIGGGVRKDSSNPHFKSSYASLEAVTAAVVPELTKQGISLLGSQKRDENGAVVVSTTLLHKSGEWLSASVEMPPGRGDAQAVGSALTYGRRYGLMALMGLAPEDDDGNAASSGGNPRAQQPAANGNGKSQNASGNGSSSGSGSGSGSGSNSGSDKDRIIERINKAPDMDTLARADEWARNNVSDEQDLNEVLKAIEVRSSQLGKEDAA